MFKKFFDYVKCTIKEEYKFLIFLVVLYIILSFPLNYYITVGGGISDVESRIEVSGKNDSEGSFNISYVTQLEGTIVTYGLSYLIPTWERENMDDYKYDDSESVKDIEFRSNLDLKAANGNATYWAYHLAGADIKMKKASLYVITTFKEYETELKVQDQILDIDGHSYQSIEEYKKYIQTKNVNDYVNVKVIRNKKEKIIKTKLHDDNGNLVLGVGLQYVKEYETDPKVKIKFKSSESGPSGGLITTLEIYDQLTKKDLSHGLKIAGTGTIEEDGKIGQIGGVEYKLLGAVKGDADLFLVPDGKNYEQAKKYKEEKNLKIKLMKVKNIEDAIEQLDKLS